MQELREFFYDELGNCPKCGNQLKPVTYYSGKKEGTSHSTETSGTYLVSKTTTKYSNVQSHVAGYCKECAKKRFEEIENAKADAVNKPKPLFCIISAVITAIGMYGGGLLRMLTNSTSTVVIIIMALGVIALPCFIIGLIIFVGKNKTYNKYKAGYRAEFTELSDQELSERIAGAMNASAKNGLEYFDQYKYFSMVVSSSMQNY